MPGEECRDRYPRGLKQAESYLGGVGVAGNCVGVGGGIVSVGGAAVAVGRVSVGVGISGVMIGVGLGAQDARKTRMRAEASLFMTEPPFPFATSGDIGGCGLTLLERIV